MRFYALGSNPPGLNWDEAALGYNAYSILKTGRDEYGKFLPLSFRSFDDYKPPLYVYLTVPAVAIFGLNEFATRLPSALFGVLTIPITYLLINELFKNRKIALLTALLLAISPWHIQISRAAFETNVALFWTILGTWLFLRAISAKDKTLTQLISLSIVSFSLALFTYQNARIFVPLFVLVLIVLYKDVIVKSKKLLIIPALVALFFLAILIPTLFSKEGLTRFKGISVFSDQIPKLKSQQQISEDKSQNLGLIGTLLHNQRFVYAPIIVQNYLVHFKPKYLFFTSDSDAHHAPEVGLLYFWDIPFIIAGLYFLFRNKYPSSAKVILISWFLLAPVGASLTWEVPHALRTAIFLPTYQVFVAIGVVSLVEFKKQRTITVILSLLLIANFLFYTYQYFLHLPKAYSKDWFYGRKQAALVAEELKGKYDRVLISNSFQQPYIFWLAYLKYDPSKYIQEGGTISGGFAEGRNHFDKYQFMHLDFDKQSLEPFKTLFVGTPNELPGGGRVIKTIYYLNGEKAIVFVSNE